MKTILPYLLLFSSNIFLAQLSTTEVVASGSVVVHENPHSIILQPGFWATSGSVFTARIGYTSFHWDCPIESEDGVHIDYTDANSYSPDAIDTSKKLLLAYDTAGNTSRIYFANAKTGLGGSGNTNHDYSIEAISSLIYVYPNPTRGKITVSWDQSVDNLIQSAVLVVPNGVNIPLHIRVVQGKRQASLTFNGAIGTHFLHITLTDARIVSKTIVKQ
jgi:hypothetical protein